MHGGNSKGPPKENSNAQKHGIYGDLIRPDDLPFVESIQSKLGAVDDELMVARLQLRRALKAQANADSLPDGMEVYETVDREGAENVTAKSETKKKLRDYPAIINTLLGRIESLERTRLELIEGESAKPGTEGGWAFTIKRAVKNATRD